MSNSAVETIRMPEVIVSAVHLDDPGSSNRRAHVVDHAKLVAVTAP